MTFMYKAFKYCKSSKMMKQTEESRSYLHINSLIFGDFGHFCNYFRVHFLPTVFFLRNIFFGPLIFKLVWIIGTWIFCIDVFNTQSFSRYKWNLSAGFCFPEKYFMANFSRKIFHDAKMFIRRIFAFYTGCLGAIVKNDLSSLKLWVKFLF